jgi:hypothetical protein
MLNSVQDMATNDMLALATWSDYQVALDPSLKGHFEAIGQKAGALWDAVQSGTLDQAGYDTQYAALVADAETPSTAGNLLLVGGAIAAGAGLLWYLTKGRES